MELDLEKLRCRLTGEKEVERLRQAMKELEKEEQMEVMRSQRRVMVEDIVQTREQVEGQARCEKGVEWLRSRAGGGALCLLRG